MMMDYPNSSIQPPNKNEFNIVQVLEPKVPYYWLLKHVGTINNEALNSVYSLTFSYTCRINIPKTSFDANYKCRLTNCQ